MYRDAAPHFSPRHSRRVRVGGAALGWLSDNPPCAEWSDKASRSGGGTVDSCYLIIIQEDVGGSGVSAGDDVGGHDAATVRAAVAGLITHREAEGRGERKRERGAGGRCTAGGKGRDGMGETKRETDRSPQRGAQMISRNAHARIPVQPADRTRRTRTVVCR